MRLPALLVTIGAGAFASCEHLQSVDIPDSVTVIGSYAFFNCYELATLSIPDSVTRIGKFAFEFCNNLSNIILRDSVEEAGIGAFSSCKCVISVNVSNRHPRFIGQAFVGFHGKFSVTIIEGDTEISDGAFCQMDNLVNVVIPDSVTAIGQAAFYV